MTNNNTFGKRLQQIRKQKGLTQEKLALGTYKPSFDKLNNILKVLDIGVNEVGLDLAKVSVNDTPFYVKSMQILNNATEQELEFYYGLLKQGQKGSEIFTTQNK